MFKMLTPKSKFHNFNLLDYESLEQAKAERTRYLWAKLRSYVLHGNLIIKNIKADMSENVEQEQSG